MEELNLLKYNRHWEKAFRYGYGKKRTIFEKLAGLIDTKQIVELAGLRRTGKTVLFFQLMDYLVGKGQNRFSIWYFTFDEGEINLDDLFQKFSIETEINFKKEKVFVFLDEIQKLENFQSQIKVYYDLYPNLKFFISGSTSLFIRKKTWESLAGRITSLFLYPLNFREYLRFREREEILEKPALFMAEIEKEFEVFLESQFVETAMMKTAEEKREYMLSIAKKIIFEDIPQIFPVENPEILWKISRAVAQEPGMVINLQNLSDDLGISAKTLSKYLFYLEESFLVKKIYNFSKNLLTSEKKLKKYYLASPSFSAAVSDFIEKGKLAENFVISLKNYQFFWRDNYGHEIDFVDVSDSKIVPIEIKYRNKVLPGEMKNLLIFAKKFKTQKAVLVEKRVIKETIKYKDLEIERCPIFFLS